MQALAISTDKKLRGFTLIEIAVVLFVVMLLLTLGLAAMNAQLSSAGYSATRQRESLIRDALIAYLGTHKRLPCPSDTSGIEPTPLPVAPGTCSPVLGMPSGYGVLPYSTLGIARDAAQDGWGNFVSYAVYSNPSPVCPGPGIDWADSICFGEGKIGNLTETDQGAVLASNGIAAVISHGGNGLGAWTVQGARNVMPMATSCEEINNASAGVGCAGTGYFKGERSDNDDVVTLVTVTDALSTLAKDGAIQSATSKANQDLQKLIEQTIGINLPNTPYVTAPPPPLPNCIAPDISNSYDPWGSPYQLLGAGASPLPDPICFYTTGGVESASPPTAACVCTGSTVCNSVTKATINTYRSRGGSLNCS